MSNKKTTIKTIALLVISVIFLVMVYITFFKTGKTIEPPVAKEPAKQTSLAVPQTAIPPVQNKAKMPETGDETVETGPVPFKKNIRNIFLPPDKAKTEFERPLETPESLKNITGLSEQEKADIQKALQFKGSMISNSNTVAIINDMFLHVGDTVNGYKITSISEKQVFLDTRRGMIILEIMKHE